MAVPGILRLRQASTATQRITLTANGRVFGAWTAVEMERDVADIAGGATLEFHDLERSRRAFPKTTYSEDAWETLECGVRATLAIDGEDVLRGWVEAIKLRLRSDEAAASINLVDDAGHLVECAAATTGPHEYRNLTVLQFAERICRPYGLTVRADVDVGAPFDRLGTDVAETALSAIEKFARQRALLVTSDGVGGLVLTRGGASPAPAALRLGENLVEVDFVDSWRGRHSEYFVKGQEEPARGPRLDGTAPVLTGPAPPLAPGVSRVERAGVVMTGHARDPEVTLYRPTVRQSKTQSGNVQEQADWMARVARGKSQQHTARVLDWRAGEERTLWRPNTRVLLDDPYSGVLEERLIGSTVYRYGPDGATTALRIVRPGAYDLDPAVRALRRQRVQGRGQDGTARPLAPPS